MLGKITFDQDIPFYDPNQDNLVAQVSTKKIIIQTPPQKNPKTIILLDCGAKRNIARCLLKRGIQVITVPWDTDIFSNKFQEKIDSTPYAMHHAPFSLLISNGPGDPKQATTAIATVKKALENKIPTLGICLGNQILNLAAGGDTQKLKYGHRSQNQPCLLENSPRCYITTQNHGFAVSRIPDGFQPWFTNANDHSNEGIIHHNLPFMSVQFHPEANAGPKDTEWIFDYFLTMSSQRTLGSSR
jgi:carbamoyl-phosphate synthase small subunit